jgi:hypothetical protein
VRCVLFVSENAAATTPHCSSPNVELSGCSRHGTSLTTVPRVLFAGVTTLLLLGLAGAELLLVVIDPNPIAIFRTVFFQQSIIAVVLMWGILLACCSLGAMVNSQLGLHRSVAMRCCCVV